MTPPPPSVLAIVIIIIVLSSSSSSSFDDPICKGAGEQGRCSPDMMYGGSYNEDAAKDQHIVFQYLRENDLKNCILNGKCCEYKPPMVVYFSCAVEESYESCKRCFGKAVKTMENGCRARAGAAVQRAVCCLRHELTADFCNGR